jgi:hypothetical protein
MPRINYVSACRKSPGNCGICGKEISGEEYNESASNIESGLNARTSMCDELEEKAGQCDSWADELGNIEIEDEPEEPDNEDKKEAWQEKLEEWREEVRSNVQDAIGNLEL